MNQTVEVLHRVYTEFISPLDPPDLSTFHIGYPVRARIPGYEPLMLQFVRFQGSPHVDYCVQLSVYNPTDHVGAFGEQIQKTYLILTARNRSQGVSEIDFTFPESCPIDGLSAKWLAACFKVLNRVHEIATQTDRQTLLPA